MTGPAGGAARATGAADRPGSPGEPVRDRRELADALRILAEELTATARGLKRALPGPDEDEDIATLWRTGLQAVQGGIEKVDRLRAGCQATVSAEAKVSGKADTAQPALAQLEQAVGKAFGAIRSALHALQRPDQPFMPETREECYMKAVSQLDELASRCTGLDRLMLGQKALGQDQAP
jgi:hypothetical protein